MTSNAIAPHEFSEFLLWAHKQNPQETNLCISNLFKVLKLSPDTREFPIHKQCTIIEEEFKSAAGHTFTNLLRRLDYEEDLSYKDIARNCATEYLQIERPSPRIRTLEKQILEEAIDKIVKDMDRDSRRAFESKIREIALEKCEDPEIRKKILAASGPITAILLGQAGGFGTYILATTTLASVAEITGLSLSFGAYTALTRGISYILGPIGLTMGLLFTAYQVGKPSYGSKILPAILLKIQLDQQFHVRSKNRTVRKITSTKKESKVVRKKVTAKKRLSSKNQKK